MGEPVYRRSSNSKRAVARFFEEWRAAIASTKDEIVIVDDFDDVGTR